MEPGALTLVRMEVDLGRLMGNYRFIKGLVPEECTVIAVVKANAFGTGLVPVARELSGGGCRHFAVATVEEGLALRAAGIEGDILVLGAIPPRFAPFLLDGGLTATCGDLDLARALGDEAKARGTSAPVHLKVDSGMGRVGFLPEEVLPAAREILSLGAVEITGIYTHFAAADEPDLSHARMQGAAFLEVTERLEKEGIRVPLRHACSSAATLNLPELHLDAVRCGIFLYGIESGYAHHPLLVKPVFEVKSELTAVRSLPPFHCVGYNLRYVTRGDARIGVVPVGFKDGFLRGTKNAEVLVRGHRVPVVGSICMDQLMVDLAAAPEAERGDEVVLIGRQGGEEITAMEYARRWDTIPASFMTIFPPRVERVYKNGKTIS